MRIFQVFPNALRKSIDILHKESEKGLRGTLFVSQNVYRSLMLSMHCRAGCPVNEGSPLFRSFPFRFRCTLL